MKKLSRSFYEEDSLAVAKKLLGKYLVHEVENKKIIGKIVEVEAYMGPEDKAAHSYNNKRTSRTEAMFGPAGHAYIYLIYGMYYCMNVVVHEENIPHAVLIRALEPVENIDLMAKLRYDCLLSSLSKQKIKNLTNGPGKLCSALGITKENYGQDLCGDILYICEKEKEPPFEIQTSPRINIDYAEEAKDFPWRFFIKDNPFVSVKK